MTSLASSTLIGLLRVVRNSTGHIVIRNVARRPVKILLKKDRNQKYPVASSDYKPRLKTKSVSLTEEDDAVKESKTVIPSGFPRFEKVGEDDAVLCRYSLQTSCKKKRTESGLMMLEGKRLISEALQARLTPKAIFFSHVDDVVSLPFQSHTFLFQKVTYNKMKRWSTLVTPPGVIGFFKIPLIASTRKPSSLPIRVICDNVRDPGNLGSIIRTAAGVGCLEVLLTVGCADVWDPKVLRCGSGSQFHVAVKSGLSWEDIQSQLKDTSSVYVADNSILSEGMGLDSVDPHAGVENESLKNLPVIPYHKVDFSREEDLYLIVGGETMGISKKVSQLQTSREIIRLHIPMENGVESLNVGTAVGVLMYEMRRQLENRVIELREITGLAANST